MTRTRFGARSSDAASRSDAALVELTRTGDTDAYSELWRRHSAAGLAVARTHTSTFDADDLVAESFARIFQAIAAGGGPTTAFRPYLFTTIRNTAAGWGRKRRDISIDNADELEDPRFTEEAELAALDGSLAVVAFRSLSKEWQEVLWYSEVEGLAPRDIAPLVGRSPNATAALAYRAREGLRQAWVQAHVAGAEPGTDCRWTLDQLGAHLRGRLPRRHRARVDAHLDECVRCAAVAQEADEANSQLGLVLLPLVAGAGGAVAYTAWLAVAGGAPADAAVIAAGATTGTGNAATGMTGTGAGAAGAAATTLGAVVSAGLVVVAVTAVVALASMSLSPPSTADSAAADSAATRADGSGSPGTPVSPVGPPESPGPSMPHTPPPVPIVPVPISSAPVVSVPLVSVPLVSAPVFAPPSAPDILEPAAGAPLITSATAVDFRGTGVAGARIVARLSGRDVGTASVAANGGWVLGVALGDVPDGTYRVDTVQRTDVGDSPAVARTIILDRVVAPPVVVSVDTGQGAEAGRYFPLLSGTAEPGATVTVAANAAPLAEVTADAAGAWSTPPIEGLSAGSAELAVTQTDRAGTVSRPSVQTVSLEVPTLQVVGTVLGFLAVVSGTPDAGIQGQVIGHTAWADARLGAAGTWNRLVPWWDARRTVVVGARYAADGRFGPTAVSAVSAVSAATDTTG
ncbi:sigma-70 family RNA polymerase sigma factor [Leifsonia poae]|uniref:sigma-70 family RNA polymerase sigma factor n=1 Tax=Leifsonia poae TaxID=110933 RepID=UPI001CBE6740|nr:sigma-70 family RNA polymerase sigma factor [Leifsonia poae]